MLVRYSILVWQSFIRTSLLLSSKLAEIIPDKPFAVVHTGRVYLGQATLAWLKPADWMPCLTGTFWMTDRDAGKKPEEGSDPKYRSRLRQDSAFFFRTRCQAKFLTCDISEFTPFTHAQRNILHINFAEQIDDWGFQTDD